jgi:hypothetical protein
MNMSTLIGKKLTGIALSKEGNVAIFSCESGEKYELSRKEFRKDFSITYNTKNLKAVIGEEITNIKVNFHPKRKCKPYKFVGNPKLNTELPDIELDEGVGIVVELGDFCFVLYCCCAKIEDLYFSLQCQLGFKTVNNGH